MDNKEEYLHTLKNTKYEVMIENTLTEIDQNVLLKLYSPLIDEKAIAVYRYLYSLIETGEKESKIFAHDSLLINCKLSDEDFINKRRQLEAIGLLDTYYLDYTYIYVVKRVLTPYEFFKNDELVALLMSVLGEDAVINLSYEFLLRKLNVQKFQKISAKFDDIYEMIDKKSINIDGYGVDSKNNGINIDNAKFDLKCFLILTEARDLVDHKILEDSNFLEKIIRYAYLYSLTPEELSEAVSNSSLIDKTINYEVLNAQVKKIYDNKNKSLGYVLKEKVPVNIRDAKLQQTINEFEHTTPNEIYKAMHNTPLLANEIEMFDNLLKDTAVPIGVINVLVSHVASRKTDIPSYQYYRKILNTWIRSGVTTTLDAINYVNGNNAAASKYEPHKKSKDVKPTPDWYDTYRKQTPPVDKTKNSDEDDGLVDIVALFNKKQKGE
jgi:replication initiation and membrane attachment protein DnaB